MRVLGLVAALALVAAPFGVAPSVHAADPADREVTRIRAHFDRVLIELAMRDVGDLSALQRRNRSRLVATLANYRERGVFPHNYDFPGQAMPYFIDRKTGTLCAVAHLLESTGRRDIVDRVARENNNVWVAELARDTALAAWLAENGITLDEAARIQVPYQATVSAPQATGYYAVAAVAPISLVTSLVTTIWNGSTNTDGHRRGVSWTGAVSSGLAVASGGLLAAVADNSGAARTAGVGVMAIGGVGLMAASASIRHHNHIMRKRHDENRPRVAQASLAPIVTGSLTNPGVGASLSLRF